MTEVTHDDLLFEIGTEELPPKALSKMLRSLEQGFTKSLNEAQLGFDSVKGYATPRRLAIVVNNLAAAQLDQKIERRGPALAAAFNQDDTPFSVSCFSSNDGSSIPQDRMNPSRAFDGVSS